jgi:glyoxalase family protein
MRLEGIHHITCVTADAPSNADFYVRVMGLRIVKKTVNQTDQTTYHIFYGDERASYGNNISFFEYRGRPNGRAGAGNVHRIVWRVGSEDALDFWEARVSDEGLASERGDGWMRFPDHEGLEHELAVVESADEALIASHPEVPADLALRGFDAVRAYSSDPQRSRGLLEETLGFSPAGEGWEARGERRGGLYVYDEPPAERGLQGAGTVHHVAWASHDEDHDRWRDRVAATGARPTPVIDRFWFRSVYFREPSGVLFELASFSPGFAADESPEHLGETLVLPPWLEGRRAEIEARLTPIENPRQVTA